LFVGNDEAITTFLKTKLACWYWTRKPS